MQKIDFTKFSPQGPIDDKSPIDKRWWLLSPNDLPDGIFRLVGFLSQNDSRRQTQYQLSTRLYGNVSLMGVNGLSTNRQANNQPAVKERVTYNVVQSVIDTVAAKMSKNKPKPLFLTSGGDWRLQRRAQKLTKFADGIFYENRADQMTIESFRNAAVLGDGLIQVLEENKRVKWEHAPAEELYVDPVEAYYGEPRQMHRVKLVDRQVLCELFPSKKQKIKEANCASTGLTGDLENVSDQVVVAESWHLPSGPDANDGLHVITIETAELFREKWTKAYFPFAKMCWSKRMRGFWGQGSAERLQSIQLEINKLLWVIQRSMHLAGSFKVLVENGSKIVKEHLNSDIGAIITYSGTPPQYITPPIVPMEYYNHLQNLKAMAFETEGVSMLSAAAQKPAGLNSGKALREYNDIESDRFQVIGQAYEQFRMDLAKLSIGVAKDIYAREKSYSVQVPDKRFIETIDWKDVDLDEDDFYMKVFPISSLPSDPAGRLQTVQEYAQAGYFSPRTARRLLNIPDTDQIEELQDAMENYLHKILEKVVEDGEYTPPEPTDDLGLAKELALEYIAQGKLNNLEEEKLDLLRTFNEQVDLLMQKASAAAQPPPQAAPAQAAPMPQPQSDLIQNVPGGM